MKTITSSAERLADVGKDLGIIVGWIVVALVLGCLTLRRRTP